MTDDLHWAEDVAREVENAKQQQQPNVCAQCGGGVGTDPPTDAPTISVGVHLLHPECVKFFK